MPLTPRLLIPLLLGGLLLAGRAAAQAPAAAHPLKVAIVSVDDAGQRADQVAAFLETAFTSSKAFGLVERQAVQQILNEQTLQSLSDSAAAAKLGRLAQADLLLLCQSVKDTKPPVVRLRLVETASGVILLDQLQELQSLTDEPAGFRQGVEGAVQKAAVPVADRKLIGVLDVSSEEPGKSLDPLATTLGVLLRVDLAKSPSVFVLEREQLRHLIDERGLSGMEVKLRASARLLQATIKRAPGQGASEKLDITVTICDLTGGKAQTLNLSESRDDIPALRRQLNESILKALAAPLPPDAAGDIRAEARAFHQHADMLLLHAYLGQSLPLAVTAYTLDPQNAYFDTIARCCHDIYNGVNPLLGDEDAVYYTHQATLEELNAALLLAQMHIDASHRITASIPAGMTDPRDLHWGPLFTNFDTLRPMFPLPAPPQNPEQKIILQLLDLTREEHRFWSDVYRAHHWSLDSFDYLTVALGPYLFPDGPQYCKAAQAAYEGFQSEQTAWLHKKTDHPPVYPDVSVTVYDLVRSGHVGNVTRNSIRPLLTWLTRQDDPLLRLQGWNTLAILDGGQNSQHSAIQVLDCLFRAKPPFDGPQNVFYDGWRSDLYLQRFFGDFAPGNFLPPNYSIYSFYNLYDTDDLRAYTTALLDELEKRHDPLPLVRWTRQTCCLLHLPPKDDLALSQRMQKLLQSKPIPGEYAQNLGIIENNLTDRIRICQQRLGLIPNNANRWDSVAVREIKYNAPPAGAPHLLWLSVDRTGKEPDLLMLWRSDPTAEHDGLADFTLVVARLPLAGGPITEIVRGTFSGPVYRFYGNLRGFRITSVLPTPDGIFISDFRRGLLVVRDGKITAWTEKDGLASDQIWSLAWANNTLYAGADNGFMTIDPHSAKCTLLASGKAPTSTTNPFVGGTPYRIANIMPSPDGKTLWLSVGGDFTRFGVWRYDMAAATYQQVVKAPDHDPELPVSLDTGPSLTWHDGNLLIIENPEGICLQTPMGLLDARTGTWLKTFYGERMDMVGVLDSFPDERDARKVWKPISYTPQHRTALTSIGVITAQGDAADSARDKGLYYNWHLEEPIAPAENEVSIRNSRIATPELCRDWKTIEEVGPGFIAASYGDPTARPVIWCLTPPKELAPPPVDWLKTPQ